MPEPNELPDDVKQKMAEYQELETEAKMLGFGTVKEYLDFVRSDDQPPSSTPNPKKEERTNLPPDKQPPAGKADDERVERAERAAYTSYLENQYTQFYVEQQMLPKNAQNAFTKDELTDVIRTKGAMLTELVRSDKSLNGNMYMAAATFLNLQKSVAERNQRRTDAQNVLDGAGGPGGPDGGALPISGPNGEIDWKKANQQLADAIAPKAGYYEG